MNDHRLDPSPNPFFSGGGSQVLDHPVLKKITGNDYKDIIYRDVPAKCPGGFHPGEKKTHRGNPRKQIMPAGMSPAKLAIPGHCQTS